ncbi:MAG: hypothetical protein ACE364_10180 [Chlorobiota bacterium]
MLKYISVFILCSTLLFSQNQIDRSESEVAQTDSNYSKWDFDFWLGAANAELRRPTIEIEYGQNEPSIHEDYLSSEINQNNRILGKIGFSSYGETVAGSGYLKYKFTSLLVANSMGDIDELLNDGTVNSNVWTFGFNSNDGYGYSLGDKTQLLLTHGAGIAWNSVNFSQTNPALDSSDLSRLELFEDGIKFGDRFEAGVKFRIIENLGLSFTYSENLILPRHLFWHWTLGKLIEGTAHGLSSYFVSTFVDSSPALVPIVYFLLHNGISYGVNRLKEDNMNWPLNTTAPMIQKNFNIGLTLIL